MQLKRIRSATFVRGLAGLAVVFTALLPAAAYFSIAYVSSAERLEHDARVQARVVSKVVTDNPEGWRDAADRLASAISEVRNAHSRTTVTDQSGEELAAVGKGGDSFRIYRKFPFYDFGAEAGDVVVSSSLQQVLMISVLLGGAGLLVGLALLKLLREKVFARMDRAERRLRQSNAELGIAATAFEGQEGILVTDTRHVILRVNRAFSRITGYAADEVIGKTPAVLSSGRHDAQFYREMRTELDENGNWQGQIWNRRKNGELYPEWLAITAVVGPDGEVAHFVGSFSDISDRVEAETQIHNLAFYDPLTSLPNRRLLMDRLQQCIVSSARTLAHNAVLFIDLDSFKALNDTRGHDIGDVVLIEIAKRLQSCVREGDTVSRLGGDEFVVLIEGLSTGEEQAALQAEKVAEKILAVIQRPVGLPGMVYHSSASIGISLFCFETKRADELLKRADTAMYQAKQAGRNAWRFFDPAMQLALEARMALESDLRQAIAKQQFQLYYQIQVDDRGRTLGAEVLLRWSHPRSGLIMPQQFIALAEETGLILSIGRWMLEAACVQLKAWQSQPLTRDLQIAVNVSAHQFRQADFVTQVREVLRRTEAPCHAAQTRTHRKPGARQH